VKELLDHREVGVGHVENHLVIASGPWTIWLPLEKEARFPRVDDVIPNPAAAVTTLQLSDNDAAFLAGNLKQLPGGDELNSPVTVDLDGQLAIRAADPTHPAGTQLILSNSTRDGAEICFNTNRSFLLKAVQLGFRRLHFMSPDAAAVCKNDRATFVWMLLGKEDPVKATENTLTISSSQHAATSTTRTLPMPKRFSTPQANTDPVAQPLPAAGPEQPGKPRRRRINKTAGSVVDQALALRSTLRDVLSQTAELVRSIKRQRKHDRMLRSTLASLKQLQAA
jgi:hypothetical protein